MTQTLYAHVNKKKKLKRENIPPPHIPQNNNIKKRQNRTQVIAQW
jgi:hypothetical protein